MRPTGIIATTFTRKAAAELQERVRVKLLGEGLTEQADALTNALIGTVHGLGVKLLRRFAYEAGVSPQVDILAEDDYARMFNQSLAAVLDIAVIEEMDELCDRLGLSEEGKPYDWRVQVQRMADVARSNKFSQADLLHSRDVSWAAFAQYLPEPLAGAAAERAANRLELLLNTTIAQVEGNEADTTKTTATALAGLQRMRGELKRRGFLFWDQWVALSKYDKKLGAKSREFAAELIEFAADHERLPAFQAQIKSFCAHIYETAAAAMTEYEQYKQRRGLIDYTDMEVLVSRLLDQEGVRATLAEELDLLLVDEFQDTSPIQLEIFIKLSRLAKQSIWVGDPKQSIYGFRGAEPRLMEAVVSAAGGIKPENILDRSWRSREDIVYATNAIFTRAFPHTPVEQVRLLPVRKRVGEPQFGLPPEPEDLNDRQGIVHWDFVLETDDGKKGRTNLAWLNDVLAAQLATHLEKNISVLPKGSRECRPLRPGDVAILCRSNKACAEMAESLAKAGLRAAVSREGLLETAEAVLILACLKYLLAQDDLAVAEIKILAQGRDLEDVMADRVKWLDEDDRIRQERADKKAGTLAADHQIGYQSPWGSDELLIQGLQELALLAVDFSTGELLNLLLERLDLRRIIAAWGGAEQRMSNVDELRRLAAEYEDRCHRRHTAASLGGWLLYLNALGAGKMDRQGAAEDPAAVNVMTYHKSKGLEWPLVICHQLEQDLRAAPWGLFIDSAEEEIDLDQPLANRTLRYWINPYGKQSQGTQLLERLEAGPEAARRRIDALAEESRLLYVGITRARDYLVFPTRDKPTSWLNRVFSKGDSGTPTLDADMSASPFDWEDKQVNKDTESCSYSKTLPAALPEITTPPFLEERSGPATNEPLFIEPSDPGFVFPHRVRCTGGLRAYGPPAPLPEGSDAVKYGTVLQLFLQSSVTLTDPREREDAARELWERFRVGEEAPVRQLLEQAESWHNFHLHNWPQATYEVNLPLRNSFGRQRFEARLDELITTPAGLVVIQQSRFSGEGWERRANQLGPFLYYAGEAASSAAGLPVLKRYVHFVALGAVAEVVIEPTP